MGWPPYHGMIWGHFTRFSGPGILRRIEVHDPCLLSRSCDVRGASYQKESGINSIALPADVIPRTLEKLAQFPPGGTNSMQRDLMSGRPSELEAHAGAVVRLGQALGVPTPVNTFLYHSLLPLELQARGRLAFPS